MKKVRQTHPTLSLIMLSLRMCTMESNVKTRAIFIYTRLCARFPAETICFVGLPHILASGTSTP